ncbi:MAG TPA: class I SAM-dependent methyltransferase [Candidatus Eisenbacteria bacterium]|nr:class I SAM-dependent methyltransferase [Candidatus Eisenbacteria bacterium]
MSTAHEPRAGRYDDFYRLFDSPVMRRIRREAYGEDIGQHSWVRPDDLRADLQRLGLTPASRLLDLGCGPCGPLTFALARTGCSGTGVDSSPAALENGRVRAAALGVESRLTLGQADLDEALPFAAGSFDAAMSLDVVIHLADRSRLYREVARILAPGGRFVVTDAGVVTGPMTDDERVKRSWNGSIQLVRPGFNETQLEAAGLRVIETEDRTKTASMNGEGRLAAMRAHRAELEAVMDASDVQGQMDYLEVVIDLAQRRAVSRIMVLAERAR